MADTDRVRDDLADARHDLRRLARLLDDAFAALEGPSGVAYDRSRITGSANAGYALWLEHGPVAAAVDAVFDHLAAALARFGVTLPDDARRSRRFGLSRAIRLLSAILDRVDVDQASERGVEALRTCRGELRGAVRALRRAQGRRLTEAERQALGRRRCSVKGCQVVHHAGGYCQEHYNHRGTIEREQRRLEQDREREQARRRQVELERQRRTG